MLTLSERDNAPCHARPSPPPFGRSPLSAMLLRRRRSFGSAPFPGAWPGLLALPTSTK